ncbi:hypothetical protein Tco_0931848 [Tanacetum coccineum]
MKRVNTFVDYKNELVEESSKKAEIEQEESSKKAEKVEEDNESEELKQCLEIVPDDGDDVTIDTTPLSTKSPTIVEYKIYQEGKKIYFQIIRADGKSQMCLTFGKMLKNFDRGDLEVLWIIVKARFKKTKPVNYMDKLLLHNLNIMFEHHIEDNVWKNQQGLVKVLNWKLYDSCGVHCVTMQSMLFYRIKSLLEVIVAQLMLLVYKLLLLVLKVNTASTKVATAQRLRLLKEFYCQRKDKDIRKDKDCLEIKITYVIIPPSPSLKSSQIQELMAKVELLKSQKDELEQQKATAKAEVASLKLKPRLSLDSDLNKKIDDFDIYNY